jgi:hypothetical protein
MKSCLKKNIALFFGLSLIGIIVSLNAVAYGEIPPFITYQGYLTTGGGLPVHGSVTMTFRIYDSTSAATALWSETRNVNITKGVYSVNLGEVTPFTATLAFDRPYFLGIQVGTDPDEMDPRLSVTSTAYAFQSQSSDASGGWVQGSNTVILGMGSNRVGIGIPDPAEELHVKGPGIVQAVYESRDSSGGIRLTATNPSTQDKQQYDLFAQPDGRFMLYDSTDSRTVLVADANGQVGIGTGLPHSKLDIGGEFRTRGNFVLTDGNGIPYPNNWIGMVNNIEETTRWLHLGGITDSGKRRLALFADRTYVYGKVGVGSGITDPAERMEVNGNVRAAGSGNGFIYPDGSKQTTAAPSTRRLPAPAYDSGWTAINADGNDNIYSHDVGGNVNDYVIDLQFKDDSGTLGLGIHNSGFGGDWTSDFYISGGCWYDFIREGITIRNLTSTTITVNRGEIDTRSDQFRVRIWTYTPLN